MSQGLNNIKDNFYIEILFVVVFFVSLMVIFLVYFSERDMSNYVYYTNCYKPISDYAVENDKTSNSILNNCGVYNNQRCCRPVGGLSDATAYAKFKQADKFSYDENTRNMCILDEKNTKYIDKKGSHIFSKQNRTYHNDVNGIAKDPVAPNKVVGTTTLTSFGGVGGRFTRGSGGTSKISSASSSSVSRSIPSTSTGGGGYTPSTGGGGY